MSPGLGLLSGAAGGLSGRVARTQKKKKDANGISNIALVRPSASRLWPHALSLSLLLPPVSKDSVNKVPVGGGLCGQLLWARSSSSPSLSHDR